ncbi:MAG: clostripain-related cysteine peptidase [Anaerolineae bacterium]
MMRRTRNTIYLLESPKHLLAILILNLILIGLVVITPAPTQAQSGGKEPGPTEALPPPPPLDPPVTGPAFNPHTRQSIDQTAARSGIKAAEFEPQLRVQLGDRPQPPEGGTSPGSAAPSQGMIGPQAVDAPDQAKALQAGGWTLKGQEDFEGQFGTGVSCNVSGGQPLWDIEDFGPDGLDRSWGDDNFRSFAGSWSAWPASSGADALDPEFFYYPNNLNSWMTCGPFDFSNAADAYADFWLWLDTELNADWFLFGASVDNNVFDVTYWSGSSDGWTYEPFWLTPYAGYSQVWLAWIFQSDANPTQNEGAWVDEISIWTYDIPSLDPQGNLIQDGSFENSGQGWQWSTNPATAASSANPVGRLNPTTVDLDSTTYVDGSWSARMFSNGSFNDFLYQPVTIPSGATSIEFNFWFGVTTLEANQGTDWFCASLTDASFSTLIVDLGCLDAAFTTGTWQEAIYSLTDQEVADAVAAGSVNLVFELYNRGAAGTGTAAWVDFVRLYAVGGQGGGYVDSNEPNDDSTSATSLACGGTATGTIGDVLNSYGDEDWFRVDNVPTGRMDINIDAETKSPPSALDSVVYLYDNSLALLDFNDDDGVTYDSYLVYTNTVPNATYYVQVVSYDGYGSSDSFYDLGVNCAGTGSGPPTPPSTPTGPADTWTLMLYLNAEDQSFEQTLRKYITDMESVLVGKTGFLTVTVLFDGPANGDTVRYLLQPGGNYTNGVNKWPLSEQNLGDRDTLAAFAKWSMDNYPAENYYLAIDDHGHGVYGISWDKTNGNDSLTPPEIYSALKDATNNGARKIDIFDYEACLMGIAENAYDVRDWVNYVTFSEQISWGIDTYPQYFSDLAGADTPLTVGTRIVNRYNAGANSAGYPNTISLIDTGQMGAVKQAVTDLANALVATGDKNAVTAARSNSQAFAADDDATNPALADYIDLWDLADKTAGLPGVASAATQVKTAVDNAVVVEQHASGNVGSFTWDHADAHGLSVYYPAGNASKAFNDYTAERLFVMSTDESGINGRWDEFLTWAVTESGNGVSNGIGGGDRKGMSGARFLQPKLGGDSFIYLPLLVK